MNYVQQYVFRDFTGPHPKDKRKSDKYMPASASISSPRRLRRKDKQRTATRPPGSELKNPHRVEGSGDDFSGIPADMKSFYFEFQRRFDQLRLGSQRVAFGLLKANTLGISVQDPAGANGEEITLTFHFPDCGQASQAEKTFLLLDTLIAVQNQLVLPLAAMIPDSGKGG